MSKWRPVRVDLLDPDGADRHPVVVVTALVSLAQVHTLVIGEDFVRRANKNVSRRI